MTKTDMFTSRKAIAGMQVALAAPCFVVFLFWNVTKESFSLQYVFRSLLYVLGLPLLLLRSTAMAQTLSLRVLGGFWVFVMLGCMFAYLWRPSRSSAVAASAGVLFWFLTTVRILLWVAERI